MTEQVDISRIVNDIKKRSGESAADSDNLTNSRIEGESVLVDYVPDFLLRGQRRFEHIEACAPKAGVNPEHEISGNSLSRFMKHVIRKISRFYINPIVEEQNEFNMELRDAVLQLSLEMEEQDRQIYELKAKVQALECESRNDE